jgi:cob(I)alamin adenosyltransferase
MYGVAVQFFESGRIPLGKDAMKLALNAESVLELLRKWHNSILHLKNNGKSSSETSLTKLFDIIENIIAHFQQQLVIHLERARADNLHDWKTFFEVLKWKVQKQQENYESHYSKFHLTAVKFHQFSLTLKKYEGFIAILRTRMDEYRSDLINYFKQEYEITSTLESPSIVSSGFAPYVAHVLHSQFFLRFPYEKELLLFIERIEVSELFQEVVDEILNYISNTVLSPTNIEIYRKSGFKRDPFYDRYFSGMFEVLEWLPLEADGQPTSEQELNLVASFIHCYRDLIQFHGTDSKKSAKLHHCLVGIWNNGISQEKNAPEVLMIWGKILQYFQKSNSFSSSFSSIPEKKKINKELEVYQKQIFDYAGQQLIIQVGLITNTRQSSLSSLSSRLSFVTEMATYLEQDRLFEANFRFLRGAFSFLSADGETASSSSVISSHGMMSLQVENLSIVDNPWIGTWNSVVVKIFPYIMDEMYRGIAFPREENILILKFLYEAMLCAIQSRYFFYRNWLLFVQELLIMTGKSAAKSTVAIRSIKSVKENAGLLTQLQGYGQSVLERNFSKMLEVEDLKRIASILHMDTDILIFTSSGCMQNALNLFYQGLKVFELNTNKHNTHHNTATDKIEDEVYPFFRLSSLYLKLHELSTQQQTTSATGNEEEIQSLSGQIQEFIDENPEVKFFIL